MLGCLLALIPMLLLLTVYVDPHVHGGGSEMMARPRPAGWLLLPDQYSATNLCQNAI